MNINFGFASYTTVGDSRSVPVTAMSGASTLLFKLGELSKGTGGWNMTITGLCSGPLLGPQQWRLSLAFAQNPDDPVVTEGYAKMFATTDLAERKRIWQGIEKYFLEEGYMMKVADIAGSLPPKPHSVLSARPPSSTSSARACGAPGAEVPLHATASVSSISIFAARTALAGSAA